MRKEIWKILKDLEKDKVTTNEAYHLLCDLYNVVGRSEQLVCNHPEDEQTWMRSGKASYCNKCNEMVKAN